MNTTIIACRTIADELNLAISETNVNYPVIWIDSGLHMNPESLKKCLQEELNKIKNIELVLLAFGYCGNALLGLEANNFRMIFPRADDCITIMLGSTKKRKEISDEKNTYFLTKGWLDYEKNIWVEYQDTVKRMGREKADRVYKIILKHYERLGVIETGAYGLEDFLKKTEVISKDLKLKHEVIPGTLNYLKKLLTGPWDDDDFITIEPEETVTMKHIYEGPDQYKSNLFLA
jgi:hypothetical protein